jgi:hypothetical protein
VNARAKQLVEIGRKAYGCESGGVDAYALLHAIAAMLAAPAPAKVSKADKPKLPFTAQALHDALKARVSHIVMCDLVNGQAFGAANRKIGQCAGLTAADLPLLIDWIEAGGFAWMTQTAPAFQTVVFKLDTWVSQAREWDRKGRPVMSRKGSVVTADTAAPDLGAAFNKGWKK